MHIANPIYDVVFKFMMEDEKVAKCFLSAIIGEEVIELDFTSQERTVRRVSTSSKKEEQEEQEICLTVCHYDFAAKIATAGGGFKTVLIEVQKAKLISDVMRFRRYLGRNYQNPDNTFGEELRKRARQIYCIFLLGYDIDVPGRPVVQIEPRVTDAATKEVLPDNNEFIQSLHHR
ncbi:MAG: hypothetical protein LBP25_06865, partial [Tannerellaceae bacterium]|nr:hypothetical protein [Tannerellaceae bacterium]